MLPQLTPTPPLSTAIPQPTASPSSPSPSSSPSLNLPQPQSQNHSQSQSKSTLTIRSRRNRIRFVFQILICLIVVYCFVHLHYFILPISFTSSSSSSSPSSSLSSSRNAKRTSSQFIRFVLQNMKSSGENGAQASGRSNLDGVERGAFFKKWADQQQNVNDADSDQSQQQIGNDGSATNQRNPKYHRPSTKGQTSNPTIAQHHLPTSEEPPDNASPSQDRIPIIPGYPETILPDYARNSEDSRNLFRDIVRLQYPPDCRTAPKMLFVEWPFGFGSATHVQVFTFEIAHKVNRTWVQVEVDEWAHFKYANQDPNCIAEGLTGFSCYFYPIGKCGSAELGIKRSMIPSSERYEKSLVSKMKDLQVTEFWAERWSDWMGQDSSLHAIPRQYAARHNQLWYQSQMIAYLFRLRPHIIQQCEAYMEDMGFFDPERSDPILGVHVRHGDKFMESKTPPFSKYMEAVRKNFHGITRVFIASDDNYVFFESEMHPDYADFEFLWVETPPFESEPWKRFRKLLCDVYILSECDHFLGTMTSNLGRLVWELMNSKRQGARMVSMDSDYWTTP